MNNLVVTQAAIELRHLRFRRGVARILRTSRVSGSVSGWFVTGDSGRSFGPILIILTSEDVTNKMLCEFMKIPTDAANIFRRSDNPKLTCVFVYVYPLFRPTADKMKMKNSDDTIVNQTRNIPASRATACPLDIIVSNII
jgi:hypothetical protein